LVGSYLLNVILAEFIDRIPKNMLLLVIAVTIHNIPEGFVVGKQHAKAHPKQTFSIFEISHISTQYLLIAIPTIIETDISDPL